MLKEIVETDNQNWFDNAVRSTDDTTPVKITLKNGKVVYLLSERDYKSVEETSYLLKSPANTERLYKALNESNVHPILPLSRWNEKLDFKTASLRRLPILDPDR
jgi:antitoxin YefM